jgi:hypothetical protein
MQAAQKRVATGTPRPAPPALAGFFPLVLRWLPYVTVGGAALAYVTLKLYAIHAVTIGDEHLYFNMAVRVNQGLVPHRDFFYTHPPLHLYLAVVAFRLFGYSLALGKMMPAAAMLIGGLMIFAIGRRALGAAEGALASALFLLSFDPLRIGSHFTGGSETFAFVMVGAWLAYRGDAVLAGIAFGLAALIAAYAAPGAAAVALLLWWRSRRAAVRFALAAAAVALAGNGVLYAVAGWDFIYQVYLSQFQKGKEGSLLHYTLYHRLGFILYENQLMTAGAVAGLVVLVRDAWRRLGGPARSGQLRLWDDPRGTAALAFVLWFVAYWGFYLSIRLQHAYYFIFIMPVLAWLSAVAYLEVGRGLLTFLRPAPVAPVSVGSPKPERRGRAAPPPRRSRRLEPLRPAGLALALTVLMVVVVDGLYGPYWLRRHGPHVERYTWKPNPYVRSLDGVVRTLLWRADYNPQDPPIGVTRYLQHESEQITVADQIYAIVQQQSAPSDTVFGEVGFIPLVASETGRRVAADLIDTSSYRISYGLSRIEDWIAQIEADRVRVLVVRPRGLPMRYPKFREYAQRTFRSVARVRDPEVGVFEIMRRIEG